MANPTTTVSLFAVGFLASGGGTHKGVAAFAESYSTTPDRINLNVRSTNKWSTWNQTDSWFESSVTASFGSNSTAAVVHQNGTGREVFVNGVSGGSSATATSPTKALRPIFLLGAEDSSLVEEMNGNLSLGLYTTRAMSSAEIKAFHDNWRTTFYTIS